MIYFCANIEIYFLITIQNVNLSSFFSFFYHLKQIISLNLHSNYKIDLTMFRIPELLEIAGFILIVILAGIGLYLLIKLLLWIKNLIDKS